MAEELPFCECGKCGLRVTKPGNRFIWGHQNRGRKHSREAKKKMVDAKTGVPNTPEHNAAISATLTDVPLSPEHCDAISKGCRNSDAVKATNDAKRGVPLSPEHIAAVKKGLKNSDAVKANADKMRGGFDLLTHHYIYDHADLSLNTVQITRSDHGKLHTLLKKLGYIVPHINLPDEPISETREDVL